ncbi:HU family DNA-binding protein [Spirochaeta dissipatitropha]
MKQTFQELPERIQNHLRGITASSGLPPGDESLQALASNWIKKRELFAGQVQALDMIELASYDPTDCRAVLLLSYSGSLMSLEAVSPSEEASEPALEAAPAAGAAVAAPKPPARKFEYASIKLRHDVPDTIQADAVQLSSEVRLDEVVTFRGSPVARSSEILHIASFPADVSPGEQNRRLREAMLFLTNGFAKLNRQLTQVNAAIDHFTTQNMVQFIAKRSGLTQAKTREVIDDYIAMIRAGMMMGERVPVGRLGRAHVQKQPARKAYMGRNPSTGEDMLISAKPPTMVPRFSFSGAVKSAAERLPVEEEDEE